MHKEQLILENSEKFSSENLDKMDDHFYIDLIFSETLYYENMMHYESLKQYKHD